MIQTVEAVINQQGAIRLLQPVRVTGARRALVTILDEKPTTVASEMTPLDESAPIEDWQRPQDDMTALRQEFAAREDVSDKEGLTIERVLADKPRLVQPGLVIGDDTGDCLVDGRPIPTLTRMEHKLLSYMYSRTEAIVSRSELCQLLWPNESEAEGVSALEKLVSRVRTKIEPAPDNPYFLLTVRGRGYRLRSA